MLIELTSEKEAVLIEGQEIALFGVKILQNPAREQLAANS